MRVTIKANDYLSIVSGGKYIYSSTVLYNFEVLAFPFCATLHPLHSVSEGNVVLFTPLHHNLLVAFQIKILH